MGALKNVGIVVLGFALLIAFTFLVLFLINATVMFATKILDYLVAAADIGTALCIFVFLPLSLFRTCRIVSVRGFLFASYVFGLSVWIYGFLVTYDFWGGVGVFIGLFLAGVGVVPLGIVAAAVHGNWYYVGELAYGLLVTFGARAFAMYLARKVDAVAIA